MYFYRCMKFSEFGFNDDVFEVIYYMGFEEVIFIQQQVILVILDNKDLLVCVQIGIGKIVVFLFFILYKLVGKEDFLINMFILVLMCELVVQIEQEIQGFFYFVFVGLVVVYGGGDGVCWDEQKLVLKDGMDIIVVMFGKLFFYLMQGYVDFFWFEYLVLDEVDKMFDMGFVEDIDCIIFYMNKMNC